MWRLAICIWASKVAFIGIAPGHCMWRLAICIWASEVAFVGIASDYCIWRLAMCNGLPNRVVLVYVLEAGHCDGLPKSHL